MLKITPPLGSKIYATHFIILIYCAYMFNKDNSSHYINVIKHQRSMQLACGTCAAPNPILKYSRCACTASADLDLEVCCSFRSWSRNCKIWSLTSLAEASALFNCSENKRNETNLKVHVQIFSSVVFNFTLNLIVQTGWFHILSEKIFILTAKMSTTLSHTRLYKLWVW